MEFLVKLVQERVGLSEEKARAAVTTVIEFVRSKLPPQMSGMLDRVLGAQSSTEPTEQPLEPSGTEQTETAPTGLMGKIMSGLRR